MVRKQYSKSDVKDLIKQYSFIEQFLSKKTNVVRDDDFLLVENKIMFFFKDEVLIPTLPTLLKNSNLLPQVIVDKGAIKFVVNGADIMRQGIIGCDNFDKDSFVVIIEETYKKPICVGQALLSSEDLLNSTSGKVIKNVHFVGDIIWDKSK